MGGYLSLLSQSFPPKSTFNVSDIPDLTGRIVIVTGANTGIGKETVKALLQHNAKVYLAARNQAKSEAAIQELKLSTGSEAIFLKLDLGNLKAVKAAAEEFLSKETRLDVLINNAGVMFSPTEDLTANGYDLQFGTNVLGHHYLTKLLLPTLISTAKASSDGKARVVTVSSSAHVMGSLNFGTFKDTSARKNISTHTLYAQSKYGNVVFALELDRRCKSEGIVSISLNPGNIRSDLQRHMGSISRSLLRTMLYDTTHGALTQLYAATSPAAAELGGQYLVPWARIGPSRKDAHDPKLGQALWEWCEEQVKDV
ncbi:NAD(P)-binding protein [Paxillus ammoniavirescens]|nr:NAD(P)-binding protein [Paxillus ammoniavirescens]